MGNYSTGDLPQLDNLPDEPRYDLNAVVQRLEVRPLILWNWEGQLGMPHHVRLLDDGGAVAHYYSERELALLEWLREQIVSGVAIHEAVQRLGDLVPSGRSGLPRAAVPAQRNTVNTGPLHPTGFTVRGPARTRQLYDDELAPPTDGRPLAAGTDQPRTRSTGVWGPGADRVRPVRGAVTSPIWSTGGWPSPVLPPSAVASSPPSHPLWMTATEESVAARELRVLVDPLLRAFAAFDTRAANRVMVEALAGRTVERVCVGLLQPAVARVGDLWARHEFTSPEERFARNYARGMLFALLHDATEWPDAPVAFVGCGPREMDDIGALMLAMFWRRAGLRVVYLGADLEAASLVQEIIRRRPALVALSIESAQRMRALLRLARAITQVPEPRPIVAFRGAAFARNLDLQRKASTVGVYLGDDPAQATFHVRRLLGAEPAR